MLICFRYQAEKKVQLFTTLLVTNIPRKQKPRRLHLLVNYVCITPDLLKPSIKGPFPHRNKEAVKSTQFLYLAPKQRTTAQTTMTRKNLCDEFVRNGGQELRCVVLGGNNVGLEGFLGVSLAIWCVLSGSLGGLLLQLVALHAVQEIGSAKINNDVQFFRLNFWYSNHLNTGFICVPGSLGVQYSNGFVI